MRNLIIVFLLLVIAPTFSWAYLSIDAQGGGPNGYNYTSRWQNNDGSIIYVYCRDAGHSKCPVLIDINSPSLSFANSYNNAVQIAFDQIQNKRLSGRVRTADGLYCEWIATIKDLSTYQIIVR